MVWNKIKTYASVVMFSHTIFSLSFALISMLLAARGIPKVSVVGWILVAFLGARTGANALNRIIDKDYDMKNPRTRDRHIPAGIVNIWEVMILTLISFSLLIVSAVMLNPLCVILLPVAIVLLILYSYTKRFTWACHIILGITCAGAPVGAWIAVTGKIGWPSLVIGAANALWVAGFDIIYGCQDVEFDRKEGLYSIPAMFGIKSALILSTLFHIASVSILAYLYFISGLGLIYIVGLSIVSILLIIEHIIVSPENLKSVKLASYSINQVVSIVFLVFSVTDILI